MTTLEGTDVGEGDLFIGFHAEKQCHVDIHAFVKCFFDGRQTLGGAGDFDHRVGPIEGIPKPAGFAECLVAIAGQQGRDFQTDVSIECPAGIVDRPEKVESGLDIPTANTLIIHRADMFGLSQLYQLRGRVGRAKSRAYAYLTIPSERPITLSAEKRLKVLQSLDSLGAGFQLASHDLDIRGGGNLLGEEQSGHIKEIGVELYQQMLEDAVNELKAHVGAEAPDRGWSPQINTGAAVLIPEDYIPDLSVRLSIYRRLSDAEKAQEREALAAELIDRFGPLPPEAGQLLKVVAIKGLCREANVAKIDVGPKGAVVTFRNDDFKNPAALVGFVAKNQVAWRLRPDHKIVVRGEWETPEQRLAAAERVLAELAKLAA